MAEIISSVIFTQNFLYINLLLIEVAELLILVLQEVAAIISSTESATIKMPLGS